MNKDIQLLVEKALRIFPKSFINDSNEIILVPKHNFYFYLGNVETEMDFNCKVLAWLSRPSVKGVSEYWQKRILNWTNELLGTSFTKEQMETIYTYLGNDIKRELSIEFIASGYNLAVIDRLVEERRIYEEENRSVAIFKEDYTDHVSTFKKGVHYPITSYSDSIYLVARSADDRRYVAAFEPEVIENLFEVKLVSELEKEEAHA